MERLPSLRVVEFYAGVGGYHYALLESGTCAEVVASVDINTNANKVYAHNFPGTLHLNRNICGITAQELDKFHPDVFFLSPPCQPFTRQGLRKDSSDRRTDSFFHLMETLPAMKCLPSCVLMENVQGFEVSKTREHFVGILRSLQYNVQEFLLSPVQFGMPNSRLRYYLLARKKPLQFPLKFPEQPSRDAQSLLEFTSQWPTSSSTDRNPTKEAIPVPDETADEGSICTHNPKKETSTSTCENAISTSGSTIPPEQSKLPHPPEHSDGGTLVSSPDSLLQGEGEDGEETRAAHPPPSRGTVSCYLEPLSDVELQAYLVPGKILRKYAMGLDIVSPSSSHSCCFTKGYGNYAVGTGSVLQHASTVDLDEAFQEFLARRKDDEVDTCVDCLLPLKLRYFTPREISNLMGFPPTHSFPSDLTVRQCYKVMGNSLNVHVVATLMKYLLHNL